MRPTLLALAALAIDLTACLPAARPARHGGEHSACARDLGACEKRLLSADASAMPAILAALDAARGDHALTDLSAALAKAAHKVPLLRMGACPACDAAIAKASAVVVVLDAVPAMAKTALDARLIALSIARGAGADQLFIADRAGISQLFARDPLEPFMAGLAPRIRVPAERIADAVLLERSIAQAFVAAARFDYAAAADAAEEIDRLRAAWPADSEAGARAAYASGVLASAGLSYEPLDRASGPPPAAAAYDPPAGSSAYADLCLVRAAPELAGQQYRKRRARIAAEASAARLASLDRIFDDQLTCPPPFAPPVAEPADLIGIDFLPGALDDNAVPGAPAAAGLLAIDAWMPRYERAAELVGRGGLGWALLSALLRERGLSAGAGVEASAAFKRVTQLAERHLAAALRLAMAHPDRARAFVLSGVAYLPGVAQDAALRDSAAKLIGGIIRLKVRAARDEEGVYDAGFAALGLAMSNPGFFQAAEFSALHAALGGRLAGDFAAKVGWRVAGLQAAYGALGAVLGDKNALAVAAPKLIAALHGDLPYPMLAALAAAAVRYGELIAQQKLDADVTNDKLMPAERLLARAELKAAIAGLAAPGPSAPPERDLLDALTDLGDGFVAALAAWAEAPSPARSCPASENPLAKPLRDAFDRLQKKRRALIKLPAMKKGDGAWARRARLLALILSDGLDLALGSTAKHDAPSSGARTAAAGRSHLFAFAIHPGDGRRIVDQALGGWIEGAGADAAASGYLVGRALLSTAKVEWSALQTDLARGVRALSRLFGNPQRRSLFALFDEALSGKGGSALALGQDLTLAGALVELAARAYQGGTPDQGDVLLLLGIAAGSYQTDGEGLAERAFGLARRYDRLVSVPLTLHQRTAAGGADPAAVSAALDKAEKGACRPPDTTPIKRVEQALFDFRRGKHRKAIDALEGVLAAAEQGGLAVPRQLYRYNEGNGRMVFTAEESISLALDLLHNASSFNLGLGFKEGATAGGSLAVSIEAPDTPDGRAEAARFYAHVAMLTAVLARLDGDASGAGAAAHKALGTWAAGVRLGDKAIAPDEKSKDWPADAIAPTAIAAEQAADAGEPFLAGLLWEAARRGLGDDADDAAVAKALSPLPLTLEGIADLDPVVKRAAASLEMLTSSLPCKKNKSTAPPHTVGCADYPLALSLRIGGGLAELPRLGPPKGDDPPACSAWRALDAFLGPASERRYEPDKFTAAVRELMRAGKAGDAALLLANQRHPQHCSPELVDDARKLARSAELGSYLRGDLLGVAVMCAGPDDIGADLELLDQLDADNALPDRSFELLLFGAKLAKAGHAGPLSTMTERPGFVERWRRISPDAGALALMLHHAAALAAGRALDLKATLPAYRLLCTSFPTAERGPVCNTIGLMRTASGGDLRVTGAAALQQFIDAASAMLQSRPAKP